MEAVSGQYINISTAQSKCPVPFNFLSPDENLYKRFGLLDQTKCSKTLINDNCGESTQNSHCCG
uniref:Putative ovule protein n=1 Tax=Solanum chacoense TaxID=4108 RepID=A0A0V0H3C8_SOLCH